MTENKRKIYKKRNKQVLSMDEQEGLRFGGNCLSPFAWVAVGVALIGGTAARLLSYLANRSLWHDEARLALNIVGRLFHGLLQPLDHGAGSPFGIPHAGETLHARVGRSEYALRLWPLLAGIFSLPLFFAVAWRAITPRGAAIGLVLFATSGSLVYYSCEVKQYSSDVMIVLLILCIAVETLRRPTRPAWFLLLGAVGAFGIWFSHPAVFVLGSVGLVFLGFPQGRLCAGPGVVALLIVWGLSVFEIISSSHKRPWAIRT